MFQLMDTVLAFAAVMLLLSLLITVIVQAVVSTLGLRGRNLVWSVGKLLQRVSPDFYDEVDEAGQEIAQAVANARSNASAKAKEVLSDPLLAPNTNGLLWTIDLLRKLAHKVFGKLMGQRMQTAVDTQRPPTAITLEDLAHLLGHHKVNVGVEIPAGPLTPDTVGKIAKSIEGWFETVTKAAGARFTLWSRWITALAAFVLAFGFQVDSLVILNKLADEQTRSGVIEQIDDINALYQSASEREGAQDTATAAEARKAIDTVLAGINDTQVVELDFIAMPWPLSRSGLRELWDTMMEGIWGKVMTVLLLSLGAPFWYGTVGRLVGFRSALKPKEEKEAPATT